MNIPLLVVGIASGFTHSLYSALAKYLLRDRVPSPFVFLLYINVLQAGVSLLLWLVIRPVFPPLAGVWPLLAAGCTCTLAYLFLYSSLSCGDVSSVMPIMGSKVIFSGVLARLVLGEGHSWPIYLAILLVAVSVGALGYSPARNAATRFHLKPVALMLLCCVIFAFTDIFIRQSLQYLDSYNFIVQYNLIVGITSLPIVLFLKARSVSLRIRGAAALAILISATLLLVATLLFVMALKIAEGVVIPNILMATRGVFIVLISLVLTHVGSTVLDQQSKAVYALRFAASLLIVLSIIIALRG